MSSIHPFSVVNVRSLEVNLHREIKAQYLFEKETSEIKFPQYQDGSFSSNFKLGLHDYLSLLKSRSAFFMAIFLTSPDALFHPPSVALFMRVMVGSLTMFFQQWTGINAILYYAPSIFAALSLTGNSISLLATGVVGIVYVGCAFHVAPKANASCSFRMFVATIPAILWVDQLGRKPTLISGAFLMGACHIIVAILVALFRDSWSTCVLFSLLVLAHSNKTVF